MKQPSSERPSQAAPARAADALVIFAKAPTPGQVKTRLCPPLTPDEAATLHGSFVLDTLERSKSAIAKFRLSADRFVACAPAASHVFFKILAARHAVGLLDQIGDELGARMHHVFTTLGSRGYQRIVLVGTDVPTLPAAHYRQAYDALNDHDLVLGPAQDGGYFLIGLKKPQSDLFRDIPWSTDRVLELTQRRATDAGLSRALLPVWRDIDTLEDLKALIAEAAADRNRPRADQAFSSRTAGALDLLAQRLRERVG
jgi:rSAM/selenodomain-associated transferase 1